MAYETYITDAVVVGSFASNTADKSYVLFTERAGLLYATARSVREERSRQRYALQDFAHITVTLVKGKAGWRIGSVDIYDNFFTTATTREARGSVVRLTKLVRRYVQGEVPDPHLYAEFLEAITFLGRSAVPDRVTFDELAAVRLLIQLGYVAPARALLPLISVAYVTLDPALVIAAEAAIHEAYRGAQAVSHLEG